MERFERRPLALKCTTCRRRALHETTVEGETLIACAICGARHGRDETEVRRLRRQQAFARALSPAHRSALSRESLLTSVLSDPWPSAVKDQAG